VPLQKIALLALRSSIVPKGKGHWPLSIISKKAEHFRSVRIEKLAQSRCARNSAKSGYTDAKGRVAPVDSIEDMNISASTVVQHSRQSGD
jgi:hypothetical protein